MTTSEWGGSREAPHQRRKGEGEAALSAGEHGRGSSAARALEPAAVLLASDILRWVLPGVAKFPKTFRYGLGARIEGALLDVMEAPRSEQRDHATARHGISVREPAAADRPARPRECGPLRGRRR